MSRQQLKGKSGQLSEASDLLPANFESEIRELEKLLKSSSLSVDKMNRLLNLYKAAEIHYSNRNEKLKNEYKSKRMCTLNLPYTKELMKSRAKR